MTIDKKALFINKITHLFPANYEKILGFMEQPLSVTFRINNLEQNKELVLSGLENLGYKIGVGPLPNSFVVLSSPPQKKLSETDFVNNGQVYIQALSSMLPVLELDPKPQDTILDLCAAPGSKTSQIANLIHDQADITAVDNNRARIFRLENNLKTQGFKNVQVLYANASGLDKNFPNFCNHFDKVLLDAPCSNEGNIHLNEPKTLKYWNPKLPKKISKLQKKLIFSSINMLKPGGTLVYSTCTFSREENEEVVDWALKKFPQMQLVNQKRVEPDGLFTGFFIAKLSKDLL